MTKQIQDIVATCHFCQAYKNSQRLEPMVPHEIEEIPWGPQVLNLLNL